jgi:hypothetical protein
MYEDFKIEEDTLKYYPGPEKFAEGIKKIYQTNLKNITYSTHTIEKKPKKDEEK